MERMDEQMFLYEGGTKAKPTMDVRMDVPGVGQIHVASITLTSTLSDPDQKKRFVEELRRRLHRGPNPKITEETS